MIPEIFQGERKAFYLLYMLLNNNLILQLISFYYSGFFISKYLFIYLTMFGLSCAHGIFIASRDLSLRVIVSPLLPAHGLGCPEACGILVC